MNPISLLSGRAFLLAALLAAAVLPIQARADDAPRFRVGFAQRDVTPPAGVPMWGYGARHDMLSEGALDPLMAKAIVIEAGGERLAIVGLDLGRGPTTAMMQQIRTEIARDNVKHVLICGSHTHHGPVIELTDEPGFGQGKFDTAVGYSKKLPLLLIEAIHEAAGQLKEAKWGIATKDVTLNRNRQSKRPVKATDPMLAVLRFDDMEGHPLAILVNFAAHPVLTDTKILKYSADYPGFLQKKVEAQLGTHCAFIQGASGDMSCNPGNLPRGPEPFGEALADHVIELARAITTEAPKTPAIAGKTERFTFPSRVNYSNPVVSAVYERGFFPEIVHNFNKEFRDGIPVELNTVLLNQELAIVAGSGEFFSNHAVRLRERAYVKNALFFGYCNGHSMYLPTIEAVSEGGYGADAPMAPAAIGAGEKMMNQALVNIYTLMGKFAAEPQAP